MDFYRKLPTGNSVLRMVLVGLSILFQAGWILLTVLVLNESYPWVEALTRLLSVAVILQLNSKNSDAAYKMPWIMLIMAFPIMGLSLYLMMDICGDLGSIGRRLKEVRKVTRKQLNAQPCTAATGSINRYLQEQMGCPVYENTAAEYYPEAADAFEALKADLDRAESFIFMEYFIVSGESAFREIGDILVRKARQGVDVRFMYDDVGSIGTANMIFAKRLAEAGIKCTVFNPAMPFLNLFMNHRDHRKITVIDGKVGFTGGFNLSDEYFGRKITYGRWKDTGIRLEGEAVRSLTAAFLEMWNASARTCKDVDRYLDVIHRAAGDCLVQPYEDDPTGRERVAETVYLNLINRAERTLYVITPYLIITDEMTRALGFAAKRGVDVRIITPGVPDKKVIYGITRSYYRGLISQGVRIFEYTPGFCHAKQMLCDSETASIGTSNLDYRSLYLHFENNVLIHGGSAVEAMAQDFENLFAQCREVTDNHCGTRSGILRLGQYILRLFAPLL